MLYEKLYALKNKLSNFSCLLSLSCAKMDMSALKSQFEFVGFIRQMSLLLSHKKNAYYLQKNLVTKIDIFI